MKKKTLVLELREAEKPHSCDGCDLWVSYSESESYDCQLSSRKDHRLHCGVQGIWKIVASGEAPE